MIEGLILRLPDFLTKSLKSAVNCDDSHVLAESTCEVLSQDGHPIAYFSEKMNDVRQRYSPYDLEFYAVVQALRYWQYYLIGNELIHFRDGKFLKINDHRWEFSIKLRGCLHSKQLA